MRLFLTSPQPLSGLPERGYNTCMRTSIRTKARYLRRSSTKAEEILWQELRNSKLSVKFRRQHPVDNYILDFYAPEIKLAIELDSYTHGIKANVEYDNERTKHLNWKGIKVIRFRNSDIEKGIEISLEIIKEEIKKLS